MADSEWSDVAVLGRVRDWVIPQLGRNSQFYWIVDDTGFPKQGTHSVGVARQYCGQLGKQDNCQVAVSLSLASERGSVPIDWRLYLPEQWAKDRRRRKKAGVPTAVKFQTKPDIALEQFRAAKAAGVPIGIVLADAGYGNETAWREALDELKLEYCVGVQSVTTVWLSGTGPVPAQGQKQNRATCDTVAACAGQYTAQCEGGGRNVATQALAHGGLARGNQRALVLALRRGASSGGASDDKGLRAPRRATMVVDRMAMTIKKNRPSIGCRRCPPQRRW